MVTAKNKSWSFIQIRPRDMRISKQFQIIKICHHSVDRSHHSNDLLTNIVITKTLDKYFNDVHFNVHSLVHPIDLCNKMIFDLKFNFTFSCSAFRQPPGLDIRPLAWSVEKQNVSTDPLRGLFMSCKIFSSLKFVEF